MKSCKQMAVVWGISERRVTEFCKEGMIPGAVKVGKRWQIPDDAKRPADKRIVTGRYIKSGVENEKKPLPVGISDYIRAQSEYYYVDKTLLIKEFLDRKAFVSLFTRPRRFGKTLNMDMLRVFFEISDEDTSRYFTDKEIWKCRDEYRKHQGKYPVIFLTFKDVKYDSWEATFAKISGLLQEEFGRHSELQNSDKLEKYEKDYFEKVLNGQANEVELSASLQKLSKMLAAHYKKAPIIIIDEYDTPIQEGYSKEFYDEIIGFMRNFFSGAFKDNSNLSYGFLTGILRIAQESIFSGLNNLTVNSVMDEEYDGFFGFTESEVGEMLAYYGASDKEEELRSWYDGYFFGNKEIYNPWSVINYLSRGCLPQAYWVNTGKNEVMEDVLKVATDDITEKLYSLIQGDRVIVDILRKMGGRLSYTQSGLFVAEADLHGTDIDVSACPDLVPILAVIGAAAEGTTRILGARRLRLKESDRLAAVTDTLGKLGAEIKSDEDSLTVQGGKKLFGGKVSAYNDHRIVMAMTAAASLCAHPVIIDGCEAVTKSYPDFFSDYQTIGGMVS